MRPPSPPFLSSHLSDNDIVYPQSPGKIWAPAPPTKGVLTEQVLVSQYLLPSGAQWPSTQTYIVSNTAPACGDLISSAFTVHERNQAANEAPAAFSVPLQYFYKAIDLAFGFFPLLQGPEQTVNAWFATTYSKAGANAQASLRDTLLMLSKAVRAREAVTAKVLPQYLLLDPTRLPFKMWI